MDFRFAIFDLRLRGILCVVCWAGVVYGQTTRSGFEQKLAAIDGKAGEVTDLRAEFVQEKHSPLLRRPLVSRGTVAAKGAASLWETVEPERMIMSSDVQTLRLYYPDQKTVEEYPITGELGMLAASPLPRLEDLRKTFEFHEDDGDGLKPADRERERRDLVAVRMTPKDEEVGKFVESVRVLLDGERGLVLVFEMIDPDGERTVIRFSDIRMNEGLADEDVRLTVKEGVKVVKPLEGVGGR